jgi:pilus assembly protein CpaC
LAKRLAAVFGLGIVVLVALSAGIKSIGLAETQLAPAIQAPLPAKPVAVSRTPIPPPPAAPPGASSGIGAAALGAPAPLVAAAPLEEPPAPSPPAAAMPAAEPLLPAAARPAPAPAADPLPAALAQKSPSAGTPAPAARPSVAQARPTPGDVLGKAAGTTAAGAKPAAKPPAAMAPAVMAPAQAAPPTGLQPVAAPAGAQPTAQPAVAGDGASVITLEMNRGQVVRLPRPASTVFIANPEIADVQVKSASLVYVFAKKVGDTTLIAVDNSDVVMLESRVVVINNHTRLRESLREILGEGERNVSIGSVGEQIVVEGSVSSPTEAENVRRLAAAMAGDEKKVINLLKVTSSAQVMLRVRVVEMTKDISKQLGFNWNVINQTDAMTIAFTMVNPNSLTIPNKFRVNATEGATTVNSVIDALEQDRLIKILAQPNLTAMSGANASFLVGGEFPILVPQGNGAIAIEYKTFGVSLAFQPTVLQSNRINLHVRPEVSELTDQGAINIAGLTVPALAVRRAETYIDIASGQSFAIAGLLRSDVVHSINKWPGLADIPILGALFRSDQFQRRESELVIIVTPYIVEPVSAPRLATPADGYQPPHDIDRILYGAQWRKTPTPGSTVPIGPRGRLAGPAGFQLE